MAVLKNKTQGNYTIVSQIVTKDRSLSLTERGMLLTLLSLPDNWNLTLKGLCQILPDGRDKIAKTLNNLIAKGYVTREQGRTDIGKFGSTDLEVHESPVQYKDTKPDPAPSDADHTAVVNIPPCPENPDTANTDTAKPYTGNPNPEKPCPENPTQYNTYISSSHKDNNQRVNTHRVCKEDTLTDSEYKQLVSEFGRENVDYQIKRIETNNYKGCKNYPTIKKWCAERVNRPGNTRRAPAKTNSFMNFEQRTYDPVELEKKLLSI